jgi:MinD-like ATPase involved in chromosome partitioning or flagellar assembly
VSVVAVVGECATTTAAALAAMWPAGERVVVAELDPTGGSLAAWLDVPRSPNLSELVASPDAGSWPVIEAACQRSATGIEALVAPVRAVEAGAALAAATASVVPVLAALDDVVVIADGGAAGGMLTPVMGAAAVVALVHRQRAGSAGAAAVALERVGHLVDLLTLRSIPFVVALIGEDPYRADEVGAFLGTEDVVPIAVDAWAAAVLAGRAGSVHRLRRSRLLRSTGALARRLSAHLRESHRLVEWGEPVTEAAE